MLHDSQIDLATSKLLTDGGSGSQELHTPASAEDVQAPFPTSLEITREQEDKLVDFVIDYVDRLSNEMGRVIQPEGRGVVNTPDSTTHLGMREIWTNRYYNHVQDRAAGPEDTIFKVSNLTASMSQRITLQMIARANSYFFSTDPWFSAVPVGIEDAPLATRIDRHCQWKFQKTELKSRLELANEFAFVRGEAVLKTTYETKERYYKKRGAVLFSAGKPVLDKTKNFIFSDRRFVDEMMPAVPTPEQMQAGQPAGPAQLVPTGRKILKSDPSISLPPDAKWTPGLWPVRNVINEAPDTQLVFYKDFLCPLNAPDIHEAELIAHIYDIPLMNLISMFKRADLKAMAASDGIKSVHNALQIIRALQGEGSSAKSAAGQSRPESGENGTAGSDESPMAEVVEAYCRYDADGDGFAEEIMVVVDRRNRIPIFYDYIENVTAKGRRPFEVLRTKAIDGRWYGMGSMEFFQPEQEFIDLLVNRQNFRMSQAGRVTFWNPAATVEGSAQPGLKLNHGKTYRLREGFKAADALSYVTLPPEDADLMQFLNFWMQLMMLKSGMINAADQESASLPTANTATGINNVEKSGQELFSAFIACLKPGHRAVLIANVQLLYKHLNAAEMFRYDNADTTLSDSIAPEDVGDLDFDIDILITRARSEQVLHMSAEARALVVEFYTVLPPQVQEVAAPMYRDSLRALGYADADKIIAAVPMAATMPGGGNQPGQPQQTSASQKPAGPAQPSAPPTPAAPAAPAQNAQKPQAAPQAIL